MNNDKTMTAHFAIIRDNSSRYNRDQICQVEEIDTSHDIDPKERTYSRCGKFRFWQAGRIFISDVMTISLDMIEDPEREIDACNLLISYLNAEAHKRLEQALEPVRARKLELMQIAYQTPPKPEAPIPEYYDETAEISPEAIKIIDELSDEFSVVTNEDDDHLFEEKNDEIPF